MKKILTIIGSLLILITLTITAGCSNTEQNKSKSVDLKAYFDSSAQIVTDSGNKVSLDIDYINGNKTPALNRYNELSLKGKSKWINGLFVEKISFEIFSSENCEFVMELFLSNIVQTENSIYNSDGLWYRKINFSTNARANEKAIVELEINEQFLKGDSFIKIVTDKIATLSTSPNMSYYITNLKIIGYHK